MGRRVYVTTPLIFQSKLLCLSLLYLLTTVPLSLYVVFSPSGGCFIRLPSLNVPNTPVFSYPGSYGERKHALPTTRSSCSTPVNFSEYGRVVEEIRRLCLSLSNEPDGSPPLRYLEAEGDTFAGNFSVQERRAFFNSEDDDRSDIPCGFLRQFPIKESDMAAMATCNGVVVASAVFNDHDKIRQPKGLGARTLETVCFFMFVDNATVEELAAHEILAIDGGDEERIGAWRIVRLPSDELPYDDPSMNGVIPKHLLHRLFPNSKFSVWVDAKLQLTVDPLLLIHALLVSKEADMAVSKHPLNVHTMEEAMATARWRKWPDVESLRVQMETYCEKGLQPWSSSKHPHPSDVPDSALILRRHGVRSNLFSCLLFNELEAFNPRDQLAFAYVRDFMTPAVKINMFEAEVFEHIAIEYRHNLKRGAAAATPVIRRASSRDISGSSCENYLLRMWGETSD